MTDLAMVERFVPWACPRRALPGAPCVAPLRPAGSRLDAGV